MLRNCSFSLLLPHTVLDPALCMHKETVSVSDACCRSESNAGQALECACVPGQRPVLGAGGPAASTVALHSDCLKCPQKPHASVCVPCLSRSVIKMSRWEFELEENALLRRLLSQLRIAIEKNRRQRKLLAELCSPTGGLVRILCHGGLSLGSDYPPRLLREEALTSVTHPLLRWRKPRLCPGPTASSVAKCDHFLGCRFCRPRLSYSFFCKLFFLLFI